MINSDDRQDGPYLGDNKADRFPFYFKVFQPSDMLVIRTNIDGSEDTLVLDATFSVTLNDDQNANPGGYITYIEAAPIGYVDPKTGYPASTVPVPLPFGYKLTISSSIPELQPTDIKNLGGFYPKVINDSLDRLTILVQQLSNAVRRSLKFPMSDASHSQVPGATDLRGRTIIFDSVTGAPIPGPTAFQIETASEQATEFLRHYLGSYDHEPTTDHQGYAITEGALYFNVIDQTMYVYTGLDWVITYGANADVVGSFGASKTPSDLPVDGFFPYSWDAPGVPYNDLQLTRGQAMIYLPANKSDPLYNQAYIFVSQKFSVTGWQNAGVFQGPEGPKGAKGDKGDDGMPGPEGPQGIAGPEGPKGDQGPTGPQGDQGPIGIQGPQGIEGPQGVQGDMGPQGIQGSPGASAVIIGSFGASKTPADLPLSGLIPKDWDAPGNPVVDYQMSPGESLIYTDGQKTDPFYGHLYGFTGTSSSDYDGSNWVDLGDIVGPQGVEGPQGPQGIQGPQGPAGQQGPQGIQGVKGETGSTGQTGPAGSNGADGPPNVLQIGTVTEGIAPDATITGTSPSQTLNLVLPRGPQGIQGLQGATGPKGADGAQGPQGPAGADGKPATGGGSDQVFILNGKTITANYTIPAGQNAGSFGPIVINTGVTVTVSTGSCWTIV